MDYICEICGAAFEGEPAPCGAEMCEECCEMCYEHDGICGYKTLDSASVIAD